MVYFVRSSAWIQELPTGFYVILILGLIACILLILAPSIVCFALYKENKDKRRADGIDSDQKKNAQRGQRIYGLLSILTLVLAIVFVWTVYSYYRTNGW